MENVQTIAAPTKEFNYFLKVKCSGCNVPVPKWQTVNSEESQPIPGCSGHAHQFVKCEQCGKVHTINVLTDTQAPYTAEDVPNFKTIISFECFGVTVTAFSFGTGWQIRSSASRKMFMNVDLNEGFSDHDDIGNCPVSITQLISKIEE